MDSIYKLSPERIAQRNAIYDKPEKVMRTLLQMIQEIKDGQSESAVCRKYAMPVSTFRCIIRKQYYVNLPVSTSIQSPKTIITWEQRFIKDVFQSEVACMGDVDRIFDKILDWLPDKQAESIRLRYLENMTYEEIAHRFHNTRQYIHQLVSRVLKKIKASEYAIELLNGTEYVEAQKKLRETAAQQNTNQRIEQIKNRIETIQEAMQKRVRNTELPWNVANWPASARCINALILSDHKTIEDVVKLSEQEVREMPNMGEKTVAELLNLLHSQGLYLQDELVIKF